MAPINIKDHIHKLYSKYLSGDISRQEYEELFDLMSDESNQDLVKSMIDETLPKQIRMIGDNRQEAGKMLRSETDLKDGISSRISPSRLAAAASILLLLGLTFFLGRSPGEDWIIYTTGYQETQNIDLPDGSTVIMNASSELKWKKGFEQEHDRIVHFSGEGFFDIAPLDRKKFTVLTKAVEVNVLGTKFNLETRRHFTNIFLEEGKVVLKTEDIQPVEMVTGDMVHYDTEKKKISKVQDQSSETALSWKEGVFTFEDLTGIQILEKMEDIYGKEFIIEEPGRLSDVIVIQGLPYTDWDFTQEALELALDITFKDSTSNKILVKIK